MPGNVDPASVIQRVRTETSDALTGAGELALDAEPQWWPVGEWGGWRLHTFGEVLLHLLVETSCHAGHLDAARELIDGSTWDYAAGRLPVTRAQPL